MDEYQEFTGDPVTPALKPPKKVKPAQASLHSYLGFSSQEELTAAQESYLKKQLILKTAVAKMKENAPTRLTQEQWDALDGKGKWDSTVALRGPDLQNSSTLKWFTSSIIRYRLSGIMRVGGLVNNEIPFVILPDGLNIRIPNFDAHHFLSHVYEAAQWLGIQQVYIGCELYKKLMFSSMHHYQAQMELYKVLNDPYKSIIGNILTAKGYNLEESPSPVGESSIEQCPE
jgi:hypothetical protein